MGMFLTSANAFTVEIPIRMPVNEPGPWQHASKFILSNVKLASFKVVSI